MAGADWTAAPAVAAARLFWRYYARHGRVCAPRAGGYATAGLLAWGDTQDVPAAVREECGGKGGEGGLGGVRPAPQCVVAPRGGV